MAFPVLKTLSILMVFLFSCALQVECKVEKYSINTVVNGTSVNEEVEVDVDQQTEVIRVNKHEILNDFTTGLSARLDRDNKTCYVSVLDPSLPSPEKMKEEMDQVSEQSQPDEERTETSVWKVVGPLNSTDLPQNISKFCETFPIFEIEVLENTALPEKSGETRSKRSIGYTDFCSYSDRLRLDSCLRRGCPYSLNYRLKYKTYCYYIYEKRIYYTGPFWRRRRVCINVRVLKCIRIITGCYSVTCD